MKREEFVTMLRSYGYPEGSIEHLWNHIGPDPDEGKVRAICEASKEAIQRLQELKGVLGDRNADPFEKIKMLRAVLRDQDKVSREEFYESCRGDFPESLIEDFWQATVDKGGITKMQLKATISMLKSDPEVQKMIKVANLMDKLENSTKKESVKREVKKEEKWFIPSNEQLN